MQLQANTAARWEPVIADLAGKRQSTLAHLEQLRAEETKAEPRHGSR